MKSELSTEMLSSPSPHSPTCEYDLSTELQLHFIVWFDSALCRIKPLVCNHFFPEIWVWTLWLWFQQLDWARSVSWNSQGTRRWKMCWLQKTCPNSGEKELLWPTVKFCYVKSWGEKVEKCNTRCSWGCWRWLYNCNVPRSIPGGDICCTWFHISLSPRFLSALYCHSLIQAQKT